MDARTHRRALRRFALLLLALLAFAPALPAAAAPRRLVEAAAPTDGTLRALAVAGGRAVYLADYDVVGRRDLYSAPLAGGAPVRLTAGLTAGAIQEFQVGPAGHIVFAVAADSGQRSLYTVPAAGGAPVPLYQPPPGSGGSRTLAFALTPAGDRVVFAVDQAALNAVELFSAPAAGGPATKLSVPLPPDTHYVGPGYVAHFKLSDDGALVVYTLVLVPGTVNLELYAVPTIGGPSVKLSGGGPYPLRDSNLLITPDNGRAIYAGQNALVSARTDGAGETVLDAGQVTGMALAPAGRVVYARAADAADPATLRRAPVAGGAPAVLSELEGYPAEPTVLVTPGGDTVIFSTGYHGQLYRVPLAGGAATPISAASQTRVIGFTPDGLRLVYRESLASAGALFSYQLAGGAPVRLDDPARTASGPGEVLITPAGDRVVYTGLVPGGEEPFATGLFSVAAAGGPTAELAPGRGTAEPLLEMHAVAPDGAVLFTSGHRNPSDPGLPFAFSRLYRAPADGSAPPALLDAARAVIAPALEWAVSPAAGRAIYRVDPRAADERAGNLYSVPLAGGAAVRLNGDEPVELFRISPDGGHVVYRTGPAGDLFSAPIAGGERAKLSGPAPAGKGGVTTFQIAAGGERVLFIAWPMLEPGPQLFTAPMRGGGGLKLADSPGAFALTPDGGRVVFVAGDELRSARADGSDVTVLGGAVPDFSISPDGRRVVYQAAAGMFGEERILASQPVAGGERTMLATLPATLASGALTVAFTPDSAAVIYRLASNPGWDGKPRRVQLLRAPIAGGDTTTLADVADGFLEFQVAPAGGRALYVTRDDAARYTLASVPTTGGAATTLGGGLGAVRLPLGFDGLGRWAVYRAGADLFAAPAAGGAPVRLNAAGPAGAFAVRPSGQVVYADGGGLYAAALGGGAARRLDEPQAPDERVGALALAEGRACYVAGSGYRPGASLPGSEALVCADLPDLPEPAAAFSAASLTVREGAGQAPLEVRLAAADGRTVLARYRVVGSNAVAGVDYTLAPSPLAFAPGETAKPLPLSVLPRRGRNGVRTLALALEAPGDAGATMTLTIADGEFEVALPLTRR